MFEAPQGPTMVGPIPGFFVPFFLMSTVLFSIYPIWDGHTDLTKKKRLSPLNHFDAGLFVVVHGHYVMTFIVGCWNYFNSSEFGIWLVRS
jgi:hypothetical protein